MLPASQLICFGSFHIVVWTAVFDNHWNTLLQNPRYLIKIKVIKLIQFNHSWQTLGMLKALYRSLNEQLTGLDLIDGEYENKKNKIIEHFHNFTTHRCNGKCTLLSLWIWLQVVVYVSFKFLLIHIDTGLESVFSDFKAHGFVLWAHFFYRKKLSNLVMHRNNLFCFP